MPRATSVGGWMGCKTCVILRYSILFFDRKLLHKVEIINWSEKCIEIPISVYSAWRWRQWQWQYTPTHTLLSQFSVREIRCVRHRPESSSIIHCETFRRIIPTERNIFQWKLAFALVFFSLLLLFCFDNFHFHTKRIGMEWIALQHHTITTVRVY